MLNVDILQNVCICGSWGSDQCNYLTFNIVLTVLKARELIQKKTLIKWHAVQIEWNELCLITKFGPNPGGREPAAF